PPQLLAAANFSALPFTDPLGFLGSEPYTLISLFSSIFIAQAAASALAKEETDGTAEFLLAKPIGRAGVVLGKAAAVITNLLVLDLALTFSMLIAFTLFIDQAYRAGTLVRLGLGLALLHLAYAAVALWISASFRSSRAAGGLALGAVIAGYFLKVLGLISDRLAWLGDLSPFTHADSARIIKQAGPSAPDAAVLLGFALAGLALAFWQYRRKDIQV
ncbi:MAG TPA: ABC transporter permease subunit, partial [Limnochordia bacterium]|nr:ABC transporter permease subunit [Limnochordia bacterium]